MARRILNTRMQNLFDLLKRVEETKLKLSPRDFEQMVMAETGYKLETWTTYRSKFLDNALIFPDEEDPVFLRVRGAIAMEPNRFADLMTMTKARASPSVDNEESWRAQLRALARLGVERQFILDGEDRQLFLGLFEKQRRLL